MPRRYEIRAIGGVWQGPGGWYAWHPCAGCGGTVAWGPYATRHEAYKGAYYGQRRGAGCGESRVCGEASRGLPVRLEGRTVRTPEDEAIDREIAQIVLDGVGRRTVRWRSRDLRVARALVMHAEGDPLREIGPALGVSPERARTLLVRGLRQARRLVWRAR